MKTNYTYGQIREFIQFCAKHGIVFNNMVEYRYAINQYFKG